MSESPPRRSNIALIVSLCVNLVLAGVNVMAVFRFVMHRPMFVPPAPMGSMAERVQVRQILAPRLLMRAAPEKTDAIRDVVRTHRDKIEALRAASAAARREVLRLYTMPAFDRPAFDKALVRMQAADAALATEALKVASEAGALLSPEERKKAAVPRDHGFGGAWQHHDGGPRPGPGDEPAR